MTRNRKLPFAFAVTFTAASVCFAPTAAAAGAPRGAELPDPASYDGAIAWMPDTQYYSAWHPEHFDAQTRWIAENAEQRKINYATHTGDIVDLAGIKGQWENASDSLSTLENSNVPYGVVEGNHDVNGMYNDYFGADRFADSPVYRESHEDNRQHYDMVDVGGKQVMMLYLTWDMSEEDFAWAENKLKENPNTPALISVHAYLNTDGSYDEQGQEIFDRLVKPYNNVQAVLSGHNHGAKHNVKDLGGGRKVSEILADYQSAEEGGSGYLRMLQFDWDKQKMIVDTYSPSLDDSNYFDGEDDFEVDLSL